MNHKLIARRELLKRVGAAAVVPPRMLLPLVSPGPASTIAAQSPSAAVGGTVETLTAAEAETLDAIAARLIPTRRQWSGRHAKRGRRISSTARLAARSQPSREAYRAGLAAVDRHAQVVTRRAIRASCRPPIRIEVLRDVERERAHGLFDRPRPRFFNLVLAHTIQGTFGDPYYGGNANFVGWDLIGYPGVRLDGDSRRSAASTRSPRPTHKSAYDYRDVLGPRPARAALGQANGRPSWRLSSSTPTSSSSGSAPPAAWRRCRSRRPGSTSSDSRPARGCAPKDFAPDELRNNVPRLAAVGAEGATARVPTHRPNASAPTRRAPAIHPMMNAVGGTTLHYWAQSWRLNPWDFKVVSETTRRYGASRIPKGSTVEDWPFGLDELEPYYDKVEYEIGVSGKAGNIKGTIDRARQHLRRARATASIRCRRCAAPASPR